RGYAGRSAAVHEGFWGGLKYEGSRELGTDTVGAQRNVYIECFELAHNITKPFLYRIIYLKHHAVHRADVLSPIGDFAGPQAAQFAPRRDFSIGRNTNGARTAATTEIRMAIDTKLSSRADRVRPPALTAV